MSPNVVLCQNLSSAQRDEAPIWSGDIIKPFLMGRNIKKWTIESPESSQIPIPKASPKEKMKIEKLVEKCLDAKGQNCEKWEAEIDKIATKLYGLQGY